MKVFTLLIPNCKGWGGGGGGGVLTDHFRVALNLIKKARLSAIVVMKIS